MLTEITTVIREVTFPRPSINNKIPILQNLTSTTFFFPFVNQKNGWPIIYLVTGSIYGVAAIVYMIAVSATEEEWNIYEEIEDSDASTTKRDEKRKKSVM